MPIHPTAVVNPGAELDPSVQVGAYAIIEGGVRISADTRIYPHAYISSGTTIGRNCEIHPFAVIGHPAQDVKWDGSDSFVSIGDDTIIREHVSVHRGTEAGSTTVVGRRCFLMAQAHVGHNCNVGDDVTLVTSAMLGGHSQIGNRAFIGGGAGTHQFVRVGELAMIAALMRVLKDVPPFMLYQEHGVAGPNVVGLRRAGYSQNERHELREAHRILYRSGLLWNDAVARVKDFVQTPAGKRLAAFVSVPGKRGYARLRGARNGTLDAAPND